MKNLMTLVAAAIAIHVDTVRAQVKHLSTSEVRGAVRGLVKDTVLAFNESKAPELLEQVEGLNEEIQLTFKQLGRAAKEGFNEAMALTKNTEKKPFGEEAQA